MAESKEPQTLRELLNMLNEQGITDYRRYERVRTFLNFKARKKGIPISGSFELTPLCNLDCKMCYVHLNKEQLRGAQLLTTDQWKEIMQQAIDAGMMYARLTGGECLTYPGFKELYLFLRERGVEVSILTNGLLMDEDMVRFLVEHPPAAIQITLYGASEEGYERVTGRRAFETVTGNMRRLMDAQMPLSIAVTPNAFMTDGKETLAYLHENGYTYQLNSGLMAPREETGRTKLDAALDTYVELLKVQLAQKGQTPAEPDPESLIEPGGRNGEERFGVGCGAGRSNFSVDWRGEMRPCNTFPCDAVSIKTLGFMEAWKRVNHIANHFPLPVECAGCAYRDSCKHCVAEHASGAAIGHASPAICAWRTRMHIEGLLRQP